MKLVDHVRYGDDAPRAAEGAFPYYHHRTVAEIDELIEREKRVLRLKRNPRPYVLPMATYYPPYLDKVLLKNFRPYWQPLRVIVGGNAHGAVAMANKLKSHGLVESRYSSPRGHLEWRLKA